jgi:hypothetical protein
VFSTDGFNSKEPARRRRYERQEVPGITHRDAIRKPRKSPPFQKTKEWGIPKGTTKNKTALFVVVGAADGDWLSRVAPFAAVAAEEFVGGLRSPLP